MSIKSFLGGALVLLLLYSDFIGQDLQDNQDSVVVFPLSGRKGKRQFAFGKRIAGWDRIAARTAYRQRVSDPHPFGMCGGFLIPP